MLDTHDFVRAARAAAILLDGEAAALTRKRGSRWRSTATGLVAAAEAAGGLFLACIITWNRRAGGRCSKSMRGAVNFDLKQENTGAGAMPREAMRFAADSLQKQQICCRRQNGPGGDAWPVGALWPGNASAPAGAGAEQAARRGEFEYSVCDLSRAGQRDSDADIGECAEQDQGRSDKYRLHCMRLLFATIPNKTGRWADGFAGINPRRSAPVPAAQISPST
jgi:hypothetical protein